MAKTGEHMLMGGARDNLIGALADLGKPLDLKPPGT